MPRHRYSAQVKDDLKQIARYIANDKPNAARQWVFQLRAKCRLASQHPEIGDERSELGNNVRSIYQGSYVIFFRRREGFVEIARNYPRRRRQSTNLTAHNPQRQNTFLPLHINA